MRSIDAQTTLIVMSDHGFAPFYWGVNLNSWLLEKGYVKLKEPVRQGQSPRFPEVDWSKTKAYALGLNGIYVNVYGRERLGTVFPGAEYEEVLDTLEADLLAMQDPRNGRNVVTLVTRTHRDLQGTHVEEGPDMIVGYNWGYRSSWKSPLGEFPPDIFINNDDAWSGDHSMDYRLVPGVLITNQRITLDSPALYDLTVAILDEYGMQKLPEMIGQDCLAPKNQ
jgi:predicted AlkP superfamily phosphohydrolase/phosphomutase